jgi:isocitrate dehydrogenase
MYWAQALASQDEDAELREMFAPLAKSLADNETAIIDELISVQGVEVDLGGYFMPDAAMSGAVMRPCATLNEIFDSVSS